jgi:hypothetical protein
VKRAGVALKDMTDSGSVPKSRPLCAWHACVESTCQIGQFVSIQQQTNRPAAEGSHLLSFSPARDASVVEDAVVERRAKGCCFGLAHVGCLDRKSGGTRWFRLLVLAYNIAVRRAECRSGTSRWRAATHRGAVSFPGEVEGHDRTSGGLLRVEITPKTIS